MVFSINKQLSNLLHYVIIAKCVQLLHNVKDLEVFFLICGFFIIVGEVIPQPFGKRILKRENHMSLQMWLYIAVTLNVHHRLF